MPSGLYTAGLSVDERRFLRATLRARGVHNVNALSEVEAMEVVIALGEPSFEKFQERSGRGKPPPVPTREETKRQEASLERMIRGF